MEAGTKPKKPTARQRILVRHAALPKAVAPMEKLPSIREAQRILSEVGYQVSHRTAFKDLQVIGKAAQ